MAVLGTVEDGEHPFRLGLKPRFFEDLPFHGPGRRIVYVSPTSRQGPESVLPLLNEQQFTFPKDYPADIDLRRRVTSLLSEELTDQDG